MSFKTVKSFDKVKDLETVLGSNYRLHGAQPQKDSQIGTQAALKAEIQKSTQHTGRNTMAHRRTSDSTDYTGRLQGTITPEPKSGHYATQAQKRDWNNHIPDNDFRYTTSTMGRQTRTHSEPRSYWCSSFGTGNYHFRIHNDNWIQKRNQQIDIMTKQTNHSKEAKFNLVEHSEKRDRVAVGQVEEPGKHQKLTKYDVNGFVYASSVFNAPAPEQDPVPAHWVCQVNGPTNQYNIVNNLDPNPFIKAHREMECKKFRDYNAGKLISAGSVQPKPVVTCHDLQSFVPVRKRIFPNHSLMAPNL